MATEPQRGIPGLVAYPRRRSLARNGVEVRLEPQAYLIASAICMAAPSPVATADLIDLIWGDREDGGPLGPAAVIDVRISGLRAPMQRLGLLFRADGRAGSLGRRAIDLLGQRRQCSGAEAALDRAPREASGQPGATEARAGFQPSSHRTVPLGAPPRPIPKSEPATTRAQPLASLSSRCCRWPVGDDSGADQMFCATPREPGATYCPHHEARASAGLPAHRTRAPHSRALQAH